LPARPPLPLSLSCLSSEGVQLGADLLFARRLGHADVATTLNEYAHLFNAREDKSAEAINAAVAALLSS
jgi:integrase